ncbi:MAG TPA: hypothetical protein VHA30_03670, partial [Patescibacteria group bacterium]|nr:hypothetical protein [Patescibacteria group bacterium]
ASGLLFNRSKLADNGYYAQYYYENREFVRYAAANFPNLSLLAVDRDLPSLEFYADRKVYAFSGATKISSGSLLLITDQPPKWPDSQLLLAGRTGKMYLVTIK